MTIIQIKKFSNNYHEIDSILSILSILRNVNGCGDISVLLDPGRFESNFGNYLKISVRTKF